jgi:hypothetical protein
MLTRISVATGLVLAAIQGAIAFGIISWTDTQLAWVNGFVLLVGAAVHSWMNPDVPFGRTAP